MNPDAISAVSLEIFRNALTATATEIVQEGLRLPALKLVGDLQALFASLAVGGANARKKSRSEVRVA